MGRRAGYEGSVLLKNDNKTLPLKTGNSVTLLGKRTHVPILGAGFGVNAVGQYITMERALCGVKTDFQNENNIKPGSEYFTTMDDFEFKDLSLEGKSDGAGAGFKLNQAMIDKYDELVKKEEYACKFNESPRSYKAREAPVSEIRFDPLDGCL